MLDWRKEEISKVEYLMQAVYEVTKQIAQEVEGHDEKLVDIAANARSANRNMKAGLREVEITAENQDSRSQKMYSCVL